MAKKKAAKDSPITSPKNSPRNSSKRDSNVYIGKKKSMNYVMAAMVILNDGPVKLLARGKTISRAVDVAEILKNNFLKGAHYGTIALGTDVIENQDNTSSNVSTIEIEILPPK